MPIKVTSALVFIKKHIKKIVFAKNESHDDIAKFIDPEFYAFQIGRPSISKTEATRHYMAAGWKQHFDPSLDFSTSDYLKRYNDVVHSGVNPLLHYIKFGAVEGRTVSGSAVLFDPTTSYPAATEVALITASFDSNFYNNQVGRNFSVVDGARHYMAVGWLEGLDPSPVFSTRAYLAHHPDVKKAGINPFRHYIEHGASEGRKAFPSRVIIVEKEHGFKTEDLPLLLDKFDSDFYNRQTSANYTAEEAVRHYLAIGWKQGLDPSPSFSTYNYCENNSDALEAGMNPLLHYVLYGENAGRQIYTSSHLLNISAPSDDDELRIIRENLDLKHYQAQVPELELTQLTAAKHYMETGWKQGLDPRPDFSTEAYLSMYPDIRSGEIIPFWHYIVAGRAEGRLAKNSNALRNRESPQQILVDIKNKVVNGQKEWEDYTYVRDKGAHTHEKQSPDLEAIAFTVNLAGANLSNALSNMDLSLCATAGTKKSMFRLSFQP
jgi:hypothetical protein